MSEKPWWADASAKRRPISAHEARKAGPKHDMTPEDIERRLQMAGAYDETVAFTRPYDEAVDGWPWADIRSPAPGVRPKAMNREDWYDYQRREDPLEPLWIVIGGFLEGLLWAWKAIRWTAPKVWFALQYAAMASQEFASSAVAAYKARDTMTPKQKKQWRALVARARLEAANRKYTGLTEAAYFIGFLLSAFIPVGTKVADLTKGFTDMNPNATMQNFGVPTIGLTLMSVAFTMGFLLVVSYLLKARRERVWFLRRIGKEPMPLARLVGRGLLLAIAGTFVFPLLWLVFSGALA